MASDDGITPVGAEIIEALGALRDALRRDHIRPRCDPSDRKNCDPAPEVGNLWDAIRAPRADCDDGRQSGEGNLP